MHEDSFVQRGVMFHNQHICLRLCKRSEIPLRKKTIKDSQNCNQWMPMESRSRIQKIDLDFLQY